MLQTKLTPASFGFDDGLIAGPEEVFFTDYFVQVSAFQHLPRIIVDSRKHERTALFVQAFMQTMDYFYSGCIDQRYAAQLPSDPVAVPRCAATTASSSRPA